jgi:putative glycosyltransferase
MRLSILTTLYRSEHYVGEFYRRITTAAATLTDDYEIVFVNDGSPDRSLETISELARRDARVVIVNLSRNFGHHKAIRAGLRYVTGDRVFLIDSDLEEPPELLLEFAREMDRTGADVVFGVQEIRSGNLFRRLSGGLAYWIYNLLASARIPQNLLAVRLMSDKFVRAFLSFPERAFALSGIWSLAGFTQHPVPVTRMDKGQTTYSLRRRVRMLVDMITGFSATPLLFGFFLGSAVLALCSAAITGVVIAWLCCLVYPSGWASAMISVWSLGGLATFALGIVGRYVAIIFLEVKKRPIAVIRATYGFPEEPVTPKATGAER